MEPLVAAHAHEMFGVLSDPAIYESANAPPPSEEWLRSRYRRLEQRRSPDGNELWLNWVARVPCGELVGYVQATRFAIGGIVHRVRCSRGLGAFALPATILLATTRIVPRCGKT